MLALFLILAAAADAAPAEVPGPPAVSLTLSEAFARATQQNGDLRAARLGVPAAEAGVEAAGQLSNPVLSGSLGPDDPTATVGVAVKLPIFGQRGTAVAAAQRDIDVARADLASRGSKLHAAVRRAYFALALADAQTELARASEDIAVRLQDMAQKKFETGSAARLEAEQAAVARKRAAQDRIDREAASVEARLALAALLGAEPGTPLRAADALVRIPGPPPLAALLERLPHNPEFEVLLRQRDAALARAGRERAAVRPLPEVSVTAERLAQPGVTDNAPVTHRIGLRGGLAFELPFLSLNRGRVHQEEFAAASADAQAGAALHRLQSEVRTAHGRLVAAAGREKFFREELLPAAVRLEEMARAGYALGRAPLFAALQAQAEVAAARSRALDAAGEAQKAFADLEEAVGASL